MKYCSLLFLTFVVLLSCSKEESAGCNQDITLTGDWPLIETLADPGDGSGTYQPVESNEVIRFNEDGTFTLSNSICGDPVGGTYSEDTLAFGIHDCAYHNDIYRYERCGNILIVFPLCIESCGRKYQKL